ncbi:MAG: PstC family ABC transporter permease [Collinsella sp.]
MDLLAGIPSIIYGFFGMVIIRPFVADLTGGLGFGALTAWFVLAIMIVPTITTLTIDALNSIPMGIREASFAMGATKWQTIYKVVLPAAQVRHRRCRRARHGPCHRRDHGRPHGRRQRARDPRVHLESGFHAHESDRARHELFLRPAPHRPVRHGRGAVHRVRVPGGLCAPAVEDEEGVDHGRQRRYP